MSRGARLGVGRVLAVGLRLWIRRFLVVHVVTVACLSPLVIVPEGHDWISDGRVQGLFGVSTVALSLSSGMLLDFGDWSSRRMIIAYFAQLAVAGLLVRDAHAQLAARAGRRRPRALLGLALWGGAGLAAFTAIDLMAASLSRSAVPALLFFVLAMLLQALLASWFWLAMPAAVVDGFGFLGALARSLRLGSGSRFRIALPLILLTKLQVGTSILVGVWERGEPSAWPYVAIGVLALTLKTTVLAATYREICILKEGLPPEEVGAIFA